MNSCHQVQTPRSKRNSERGAILVEGPFVFAVAIFILASTFDFIRLSYLYTAGGHAAMKTARWATLGENLEGQTREDSIKAMLKQFGASYGVAIDDRYVKICPAVNLDCAVDSAGGPNDMFYISYRLPIRFFTLGYEAELTFGTFAENEPYDGAFREEESDEV